MVEREVALGGDLKDIKIKTSHHPKWSNLKGSVHAKIIFPDILVKSWN